MKTSWMRIKDFEEKYKVHSGQVQTMYVNDRLPSTSIKRVKLIDDKRLIPFIDELAFIRRKDFRIKIWDMNHSLYYILMQDMGQKHLADKLEVMTGLSSKSWNTFMASSLFTIVPEGIMDFKITANHWMFNRMTRHLVKEHLNKYGLKLNKHNIETMLMKDVI